MAGKITYHFSDAGNAENFAQKYKGKLLYDHLKSSWYIYNGTIWTPDEDGYLSRSAITLIREVTKGAPTVERMKQESKTKLDAMVHLAKSQDGISNNGRSWNKYPMLLSCPNGPIDLETGRLLKPTSTRFLSMQTNVAYDSKSSPPTRWMQFIKEVWPNENIRDYIWRAIGYSLTGDVSKQCYFALFGTGSNGKSTFFSIINRILGHYGHTMKFTALEHSKRGSMSNDIVEISGKRFVVASETNDRVYLNEGLVKSLTGGDDIVARQLYERNINFRPEMKLWLAFNHKPHVADQSPGFWGRTRLIEMTTRWSRDNGMDGLPLPDYSLEAALLSELPGILHWAVQGCLEYQLRGLAACDEIRRATAQYQAENHPLFDFLRTYYERDIQGYVIRQEVYDQYLLYCNRYRERPKKQFEFNQLMEELKFTKTDVTKKRLRVWKGLRIKDDIEPISQQSSDDLEITVH